MLMLPQELLPMHLYLLYPTMQVVYDRVGAPVLRDGREPLVLHADQLGEPPVV